MDETSIARPGICPHCCGIDLDRGATGLDECRLCGGLSRDGMTLGEWAGKNPERVQALETFAQQVIDLDTVYGSQDVVVADLADKARRALGR